MESTRLPLIVATSQDVAALERDLRTHKRRRAERIHLAVPRLDEATQNRLARDINAGYFACGCAEATALGLAGLVAGAAWAVSQGLLPGQWLAALGWSLGGFATGVSVGKLAGKRLAAMKMARAVTELRDHFGPEELPRDKPTAACAVHAH